jgi:DNA-directed RNA polymerase III subunit RPC1
MSRLAKFSARFVGEHGFSIGITDVTPAATLLCEKQATLDLSYSIVAKLVRDYKADSLELLPGCDDEESLEVRLS